MTKENLANQDIKAAITIITLNQMEKVASIMSMEMAKLCLKEAMNLIFIPLQKLGITAKTKLDGTLDGRNR